MATRRVEEQLDRISALREVPTAEAIPALRKGLADRVNVVVAKAAKVAAERQLRELIPDLLAAFDRMFEHPAERDPQCWAKNALASALRDLEHRESAPFQRGMRHVQMEPVWGKHEDTAQPLRGICRNGAPLVGNNMKRFQYEKGSLLLAGLYPFGYAEASSPAN